MEKKKIKFTDLLVNPIPYEYNLLPFTPKKLGQTQFENDDEKTLPLMSPKKKIRIHGKPEKDTEIYIPFDYVNWEKDIIYDDKDKDKSKLTENSDDFNIEYEKDLPLKFLLNDILSEKWENKISNPSTNIQLLYNDPNLIFTTVERKKKKYKKYNLSNDKYYTIKKQRKTETLNILGIQHSPVALQLNDIFYKTSFTKNDIVNWHRPYLKNYNELFEKIGTIKFTNSFESKSLNIKNVNDLSLTDRCSFCLIEYCEEYPFFINNGGMVSLICEYERIGKPSIKDTKNENDNLSSSSSLTPNNSFFKKVVLQENDPSPFPVGDVKPGKSLLCLSNNLFKTPLYKQESKNLFMVIYNENEPENSLIRPIDHLLVTGQEFPTEEVFSPHSKTLNSYCKNRLKMCALRFVEQRKEKMREKSNEKGSENDIIIKMKDLDDMFPTFSEGLKRKWLKEFAEKRKDNCYVLNLRGYIKDEDILTPENVCQYESMVVGERLVKDMVVENELSPWNLTRNFLKGTYEVNGKGDSLNGNGFSFFRGIAEKDLIEKTWEKMENFVKNRYNFNELKPKEIKEYRNIGKNEKDMNINTKKEFQKNGEFKQGIKITRIIKGKKEEEIVTDSEIIKIYLQERKKIKKEEKKPSMKCSRCGEIGHMKTNKVCPFYEGQKVNKKTRELNYRRKRNLISDTINSVLNFCFAIPFSTVFHRPVNLKKFPNYINFVEKPIDLSMMRSKARQHKYKGFNEFMDDLQLMHRNCVAYNGKEHSFTVIANEMIKFANEEYMKNKDELISANKTVLEESSLRNSEV